MNCSVEYCPEELNFNIKDITPRKKRKILGTAARRGWTCGASGLCFFCPQHSDPDTKLLHSKINPKYKL